MHISAVPFVWKICYKGHPPSTTAAISIMPTVYGTGCLTPFRKSAFLHALNALILCRVYSNSSLWIFRLLRWCVFRQNTPSSLSLWGSGSTVLGRPAESSWGPLMPHRRRAESAMLKCVPDAEKLYGGRLQSMCAAQAKKKTSYGLRRIKVGRDVTVATLWSSGLRGALI